MAAIPTNTLAAHVTRGPAQRLAYPADTFDAVITDPPYYDNISYAELADFFYVWFKRSLRQVFPDHCASQLTPKKEEIVAAAYRQGGSARSARRFYEDSLEMAWQEAARVLKPNGVFVCVYAHKTTLGWATLVESLRKAGFAIQEAWPLHSEMQARVSHQEDAALASSIFLVVRKRDEVVAGNFEEVVRPELERIVRERVETLWAMGISGADLVIACVGAGLQAFTRFARVEYSNGDEVPAERFLAEVETVVLDRILARLSTEVSGKTGEGRSSLAGIDPATRFYILWRYTYRWTELDAGEAIVFANGTHVELEGLGSLTHGSRALVEKNKNKYRLRDYADRGEDENLGMPDDSGGAPIIDRLHRTLWLMEKRPRLVSEFLRESGVNREHMRVVAQALAGPALKGGDISDVSPTSELAALARITANWRSVVEDGALTEDEKEERKTGQKSLFGKEKKQ